jgi:hypothetical protein
VLAAPVAPAEVAAARMVVAGTRLMLERVTQTRPTEVVPAASKRIQVGQALGRPTR